MSGSGIGLPSPSPFSQCVIQPYIASRIGLMVAVRRLKGRMNYLIFGVVEFEDRLCPFQALVRLGDAELERILAWR